MNLSEILFLIAVFIPCAVTLYAIFDIFKSKFKEKNRQLIFLLLVILLPFVGSVIYLFIGKDYKN